MADTRRQDASAILEAAQRLAAAAEVYVNRAPKVKRIEAERAALLDAIAQAQLVLSVQRLPTIPKERPAAASPDVKATEELAAQLKRSQTALRNLQRRLRPLSAELDALQRGAAHVKALLEESLPEAA